MATQAADIAFGEASEHSNLDLLQNFIGDTLHRHGGYEIFDFSNPTKTIFVELKSRRIKHDTYETAMVGLNKVAFAAQAPDVTFWFAFCYSDGVYAIKYDKDLFDDFEVRHNYWRGPRSDTRNKPQSIVFIPVELLKKVEYVDEDFEDESVFNCVDERVTPFSAGRSSPESTARPSGGAGECARPSGGAGDC